MQIDNIDKSTEECCSVSTYHQKVYDMTTLLLSYPPKVAWICRSCGYEGTQTLSQDNNNSEYYRVKRLFKSENDY